MASLTVTHTTSESSNTLTPLVHQSNSFYGEGQQVGSYQHTKPPTPLNEEQERVVHEKIVALAAAQVGVQVQALLETPPDPSFPREIAQQIEAWKIRLQQCSVEDQETLALELALFIHRILRPALEGRDLSVQCKLLELEDRCTAILRLFLGTAVDSFVDECDLDFRQAALFQEGCNQIAAFKERVRQKLVQLDTRMKALQEVTLSASEVATKTQRVAQKVAQQADQLHSEVVELAEEIGALKDQDQAALDCKQWVGRLNEL